MNRSILSPLVVAAILSVAALSTDEQPLAGRPAPIVDASCKPLAPIDVSLIQTQGAGDRVDLAFSLRPIRALRDVRWEVELPDDAGLLLGSRQGAADGTPDVETRGQLRLAMPVDDGFRRVRLTVHAVMTGTDELGNSFDEPLAVSRTLSWGTLPPVGAVVVTPDGATGELEPVVRLATSHRPGR